MAVEQSGYQDYQQYTQSHQYVTVSGIMQLPVACLESQTRLIRLHGGYGKRVVDFTAVRRGRPPVIPVPENTDNDTLLDSVIQPDMPCPNEASGGYDWSVKGQYVYAQNTLRVAGADNFPTAQYPFALPVQDAMSSALTTGISQADQNAVYLGDNLVDLTDGVYVWPFTDMPPVFTASLLS